MKTVFSMLILRVPLSGDSRNAGMQPVQYDATAVENVIDAFNEHDGHKMLRYYPAEATAASGLHRQLPTGFGNPRCYRYGGANKQTCK